MYIVNTNYYSHMGTVSSRNKKFIKGDVILIMNMQEETFYEYIEQSYHNIEREATSVWVNEILWVDDIKIFIYEYEGKRRLPKSLLLEDSTVNLGQLKDFKENNPEYFV